MADVSHTSNRTNLVYILSRFATQSGGRLVASVILIVGLLISSVLDSTPYEGVRQSIFDIYQQLSPRLVDSHPAVIIDIDEASLSAYGQWPWPRTLTAKLVRKVAALEPAAMAFDIIMPEPDRLSPGQIADLNPLIDPDIKEKLKALPSNDVLLGQTLGSHPFVVARAGRLITDQPEPTTLPSMHSMSVDGPEQTQRLLFFNDLLSNVPAIEAGAQGFGLVNTQRDYDGVVRDVPLVMSVRGQAVPSLALEALRVASGANWITLKSDQDGIVGVRLGEVLIPTNADGKLTLHFSRSDRNRRISAADILADKIHVEAIRGRVAFIGVTGLGLTDVVPTPVDGRMDGVEIHAQVIENIIAGSRLIRPVNALILESTTLAVVGLLLIMLLPRLSPGFAVALTAVVIIALVSSAYMAFTRESYLFDPLYPSLIVILITLSILAALLAESIQSRRQLNHDLTQERISSARMAGELGAAREIQMGMLPDPEQIANLPNSVTVHAMLEPAREVGGDLYDIYMLNDTELFFMIGDVTGKGVPASLFMALSKALCKNIVMRPDMEVGHAIQDVNAAISRENPAQMFITLIAGTLDTSSGHGTLCIAGHETPMAVIPGAPCRELHTVGGPPLCVLDDFDYQAETFELAVGEILLLSTDGIGEASDENDQLYGRERVKQFINSLSRGASPKEVVEGLYVDSQHFAQHDENPDDVTILAVQYLGP